MLSILLIFPFLNFLHNVHIANSTCLALTWMHLPLRFHVNGVFHQPLKSLLFKVHIAPVWSPCASVCKPLHLILMVQQRASALECRVLWGSLINGGGGALSKPQRTGPNQAEVLHSITSARYHLDCTIEWQIKH